MPPCPPDPEPWDDDTADAVALVQAVRDDDSLTCPALRAILRNGDVFGIAVVLGKLLAEACDDLEVDPEHFRAWARAAVSRP